MIRAREFPSTRPKIYDWRALKPPHPIFSCGRDAAEIGWGQVAHSRALSIYAVSVATPPLSVAGLGRFGPIWDHLAGFESGGSAAGSGQIMSWMSSDVMPWRVVTI